MTKSESALEMLIKFVCIDVLNLAFSDHINECSRCKKNIRELLEHKINLLEESE